MCPKTSFLHHLTVVDVQKRCIYLKVGHYDWLNTANYLQIHIHLQEQIYL